MRESGRGTLSPSTDQSAQCPLLKVDRPPRTAAAWATGTTRRLKTCKPGIAGRDFRMASLPLQSSGFRGGGAFMRGIGFLLALVILPLIGGAALAQEGRGWLG